MLPRKPPWGTWVLITEIARHPLRVAARGCSSPGLVSSSSLPLHRWHHDKVPLVLQRLYSNATPSGAFWKGARLN